MNLFSSFNSLRGGCSRIIFLAIFFTTLLAMLPPAPRAFADDINPDADIPDASTLDSTPANPVLEIPQQCDQDSVAMICNKATSDTASADAASGPDGGGSNLASYPSND